MCGEERKLVEEAFDTNFIAPVGPHLARFEEDFRAYTGQKHAVALNSGTGAIHIALRLHGVKAGDEVIASSLTFIGSVAPMTYLGATPFFIDCDEHSWNLDPTLLAEEIELRAREGRLPRAVLPTDIYGQSADLDAIKAICEPHGVPVIADAAEAMGARYKDRHAGDGVDAAVFSFNGNKIITTGGGGMLASADGEFIEKARYLATQARSPQPYYEHVEVGYNYRLSNIAAAIGIGQLHALDDRVRRKREIFSAYQERLANTPGITFMPEADYGSCTRWLTVIQIDRDAFGADPETIRLALEEDNIESRPVWKPMHLQPVFAAQGKRGGAVSERLFKNGLCLPSGTALTEGELDEICERFIACGH
ncbi:MAG: dTDP-4-amino-4,6-dideoxygalactose transaminase [Kiritimatiellia bacterium]|jgi:dTDP-4-amino-4,6-dideoxygalactose transaminase